MKWKCKTLTQKDERVLTTNHHQSSTHSMGTPTLQAILKMRQLGLLMSPIKTIAYTALKDKEGLNICICGRQDWRHQPKHQS
ncbi:MAG: hypothetical protein R2788_19075 [Saprospiraceae bacterium]